MAGLLLDTNAILFFTQNSDRLSARAYERMRDRTENVFFSCVSAGELACLQERNRISINEHWRTWLDRVTRQHKWMPLDISYRMMQEAFSLPEPIHRDPADRIIIASARLMNLEVVTTDSAILAYPHVRSIS